jgi:hypothetical protein
MAGQKAAVALTLLTGTDEDTAGLAPTLGTPVDGRGLLAGLVIGTLGALDDVAVTRTSAVWELRGAGPRLGAAALQRDERLGSVPRCGSAATTRPRR